MVSATATTRTLKAGRHTLHLTQSLPGETTHRGTVTIRPTTWAVSCSCGFESGEAGLTIDEVLDHGNGHKG